jgi:hypothetical protein
VVEARLYTLHRGVLPVFSKSWYCRGKSCSLLCSYTYPNLHKGCHIRFYHNYYVREASDPNAQREYYFQQVPKYIHVAEATYIELALCHFFTIQMALEQYVL